MMKSSVYHVIEKMNELEKKADHLSDKAFDKLQNGNRKSCEYYEREADNIRNEIKGMAACLKALGLNAWRECNLNTHYYGVWHVPLDDIENAC